MQNRRDILKGAGAGLLLAGSGAAFAQTPAAPFADVDP